MKSTASPTDEANPLPAHVPETVRRALREAKERLRRVYGERLRRVVLYGSYARGEATDDSDVDLLVVLNGPITNNYQEIKRTINISVAALEEYRLHLSLVHYTEADFQDRRRSFIRNVHADGIEL